MCTKQKRRFRYTLFKYNYRNESKILTKHISCKCKCKFDDRKCNSNQKCNNDTCWHECKNGKYLGSIIDNSVIMC